MDSTIPAFVDMLVILLVFSLMRVLHGARISTCASNTTISHALNSDATHIGLRGVNDIIISCFATIFACTWSAVHPNIPAPTDCWWTRLRRQIRTMVYALLAPEAITAFALRQHFAARQIVDDYNTMLGDCECEILLVIPEVTYLATKYRSLQPRA